MSALTDIRHDLIQFSATAKRPTAPALSLAGGELRLVCGRVHEVMGEARASLALSALSASYKPALWISPVRESETWRARGLAAFAKTPPTLVQTLSRSETLWAAEEALRCSGAGLVIADVDLGPDLFESRRLQIAAQAGQTTGLILISRRAQSSAAQTRWQCAFDPEAASGWRWEMTKNKQGELSAHDVRITLPCPKSWPRDLIRRDNLSLGTKGGHHATARITALPRGLVSATPA